MMLSGEHSSRRCIMAMTVQQMQPVAHLPLVLGVLRRLEVATVIDRLIPPHPAHQLSCGRGVEALVLAILDGHHALDKVGKRLEERGMLALLLSTPWRSMPLPHHGCIRTRPPLPCMEHTQTNRRPQEPPGRPMAIAKTVVMISNRCSSVLGAAAMEVSRCASGCGTATAVIVWRRRWRLRSVWRWAVRGYAGSWRIVRPIVAVPWGCVSSMDSG